MTADGDQVDVILVGVANDQTVGPAPAAVGVEGDAVLRGESTGVLEDRIGRLGQAVLVRHVAGHPRERAEIPLAALEDVQRRELGVRELFHRVRERFARSFRFVDRDEYVFYHANTFV